MTSLMRGSALVVASVLSIGCGGGEGGGAPTGALSCTSTYDQSDYWRLSVTGSTDVTVSVDTIAAGTAFDPAFEVYTVNAWNNDPSLIDLGSWITDGDDDFPCTFPPLDFSCPEATTTVTEDVAILVSNLGECTGSTGQYVLTVTGGTLEFLGTVTYGP